MYVNTIDDVTNYEKHHGSNNKIWQNNKTIDPETSVFMIKCTCFMRYMDLTDEKILYYSNASILCVCFISISFERLQLFIATEGGSLYGKLSIEGTRTNWLRYDRS